MSLINKYFKLNFNNKSDLISQITISLFIILFSFNVLSGQSIDQREDTYSKISRMIQHLQYWQSHTVEIKNDQSLQSESSLFEIYNTNIDTISNNEYMLYLSLPTYMGALTTQLQYKIEKMKNGQNIKYMDNLKMFDSSLVYDNSVRIDFSEIKLKNSIFSIIKKRFDYYRTISLPPSYQSKPLSDIDVPVDLTVYGRDNVNLKYRNTEKWFRIIKKLAGKKRLYSGLISVGKKDTILSVKYYINLTTELARGHHFFIINENLLRNNGGYRTKDYKISFYPYVRSDNVLDIFDQNKMGGTGKVKIHLN